MTVRFEGARVDGGEAHVRILGTGDGPFDLWFRVHGAPITLTPEALASVVLPVAMAEGTDVDLGSARLDPTFAEGLATWQEVFATWYPDRLRRVAVTARLGRPARRPATGVGCFFTGGVDSFHSVLANLDRLTHLVFVHGFDVPLEGAPALRDEVTRHLREAAAELGRPLVEVETNLRAFSDSRRSQWGTTYHGAALAAVAHLLAPTLGEVVVGATHTYADLFAYGSHPLTDPALSSSRVRLTHHGADADRVDKTIRCAASPVAMAHLRVCWQNPDEAYNCGRCKKCVRTMVALRIAGRLEECRTLPHALDLDAVAALPLGDRNTLARHAELIRHLRRLGTEPELLAACEEVVRRERPAEVRWGDGDWTELVPLLGESAG